MENKTGKYFKYAIGEILLVVIGILIALQINNWNEVKKERLKEQELLVQLRSEYQSNLEQLYQKDAMRNTMIASSLKLLEYIDFPEKRNTDSLYKFLSHTVLAPTFDPIVNDIISSGRIQLLQNKRLKDLLSRWTSEVIQVTEEELAWLRYKDTHYALFLSEFNLRRTLLNKYWQNNIMDAFYLDEGKKSNFSIGDSKRNIELSKLYDDSNFEGHIASCASFSKIVNEQSETLRERIIEILQLIEQDIQE